MEIKNDETRDPNRKKLIYEDLTYAINGIMFDVYNALGPGFTEDIYHQAVLVELKERGIKFDTEKIIDVFYKGKFVGKYRLDLVIDDKIIIELKAVSALNDVYKAQVVSYLKATGMKLGLLVNFGGKDVRPIRILNNDYSEKSVYPRNP